MNPKHETLKQKPYTRKPEPRTRKPHFLCFSTAVQDLPTETKVEGGTSQSKSGTSVNVSNSGNLARAQLVFRRVAKDVRRKRVLERQERQLIQAPLPRIHFGS